LPAPPVWEKPQRPPWVTVLVPLLSSSSFLAYGAVRGELPLLLVGLAVVAGSILAPFLLHSSSVRAAKKRYGLRGDRFLELCKAIDPEAERVKGELQDRLKDAHIPVGEVRRLAEDPRLWKRPRGDANFLRVQLGTARVPSGVTVDVPATASLDADEI